MPHPRENRKARKRRMAKNTRCTLDRYDFRRYVKAIRRMAHAAARMYSAKVWRVVTVEELIAILKAEKR